MHACMMTVKWLVPEIPVAGLIYFNLDYYYLFMIYFNLH